jgi:hypothetical protein
MRKLAAYVRVVVCALVLTAAGTAVGSAEASPLQFQARLSPHGRWLDSSRYGRVWQPFVAKPGWNPYYDGHWEYTDVGHTWVSDYSWGTVAYHYGTWAVEPGRGWVWIPGDIWAPSWVVFRTGPDFIGWAPVAPGFAVGGAIVSGPDFDASFVFVPSRQFFAPRVRTCVLPASRTTVTVTKTRIVQKSLYIENHIVVNRGPSVEELSHATGHPVRIVRLESVKGMDPGVRREMKVDDSRARGLVRVSEPRMASKGPAMTRASASNEYDAHGDPPRAAEDRGRAHEAAAERTAYDEVDRSGKTRVAHQDLYDHKDESTRPSVRTRESSDGETQSDRDAKLLASRERQDRARARTPEKLSRPKTRS